MSQIGVEERLVRDLVGTVFRQADLLKQSKAVIDGLVREYVAEVHSELESPGQRQARVAAANLLYKIGEETGG